MCLAEVGKNEGEKHHAYIEAESRTVVARGWGGGEKGDTSQSAQTSVILIPDQLSN